MQKDQFEWDFSSFNPKRVTDSVQSQSLTDDRIKQSKGEISQMVSRAQTNLKKFHAVNSKMLNDAQKKVTNLNVHAQKILITVHSNAQVKMLLQKVSLELNRIVTSVKLADLTHLIITRVDQASLTKAQKTLAISEVTAAKDLSDQSIDQAKDIPTIQSAFVSGINAINGALAKYIVDSQINAVNQVKSSVTEVKHYVDHHQFLDDDVKIVADHYINQIRESTIQNLMASGNFVELTKLYRQGFHQLKQIKQDKLRGLRNLTAFDQYIRQVKSLLLTLTLPSEKKFDLSGHIDKIKHKMLDQVKQLSYQDIDNRDLISQERDVADMILNAVSSNYQNKLGHQTLMTKDQRQDLIQQLQLATKSVTFDHGDIKEQLIRSLHHLQQLIQHRESVISSNQIQRFIHGIQDRINQLSEISDTDKQYLLVQILSYSQRLQKQHTASLTIKKTMNQFLNDQHQFVQTLSMHDQITKLLMQINFSHLTKDQKHQLVQRLNKVQHDANLDYGNRRLIISTIASRTLELDRKQVIDRLASVTQDALQHIDELNALTLKSSLDKNLNNFKKQASAIDQMMELDHTEQLHENYVYQRIYMTGDDSDKVQLMESLINKAQKLHQHVNEAILQPRLQVMLNDPLDQFINLQLGLIDKQTNQQGVNIQYHQALAGIKVWVKASLKNMKHAYSEQLNRFVKIVSYQLKAYASSDINYHLGELSSNGKMKINGAMTLLKIESAKQQTEQKVNQFANHMIGAQDTKKAEVHQRLSKLIATAKHQLGDYVQPELNNQLLQSVNRANVKINRSFDKNAAIEYQECQQALSHIVRHRYAQVWATKLHQAQNEANILTNVPAHAEQSAQKNMQIMNKNVSFQIRYQPVDQLMTVIKSHHIELQHLINQLSFMDPAKQAVRGKLQRLINQLKSDAIKYQADKAQKKAIAKLNRLSQTLDRQLCLSDDHQLHHIYHVNYKQLMATQLKIVRKAQLERYGKSFKHVEDQLQVTKFLADSEIRKAESKYNRYYHKTMYDIKHAPDVTFCLHNQKVGEQSLIKVSAWVQSTNTHKQHVYQTISNKIRAARKQVHNLHYLQDKDKSSSDLLLKQAGEQASQRVRDATTDKQLLDTKTQSNVSIRQIVNEVSSADVLLSAIKSANDKVSESTLDKQEKAKTLKQIHEIINNGIKSRVDKAQNKARKQADEIKANQEKHQAALNRQKAPKKRNLVTTFFNAIGYFFKWLFGKLARVF